MKTTNFKLALCAGLFLFSVNQISAQSQNSVTIYEHINYGGKSKSFSEGNHDITSTDMNDIVSSIKVPKGYKVTVYKDWKFTGESKVYSVDVADLMVEKFNDVISSIKVEKVAAVSSADEPVVKNIASVWSKKVGNTQHKITYFQITKDKAGNTTGGHYMYEEMTNGSKLTLYTDFTYDHKTEKMKYKVTHALKDGKAYPSMVGSSEERRWFVRPDGNLSISKTNTPSNNDVWTPVK